MSDASSPAHDWNDARSVHVGIDVVEPRVFGELLPRLRSASRDAMAMRSFADSLGCASRLLVNEDATLERVTASLEAAIERMVAGDLLLVSFSGHGSSLQGAGDDADGWDESWCLFDGILIDDEFHDLLAAAPAGADVVVVTDACFASGIVDAPRGAAVFDPPESLTAAAVTAGVASDVTKFTPRAPLGSDEELLALFRRQERVRPRPRLGAGGRAFAANLIALSAADERELAFEDDRGGLFTSSLLEAIGEAAGGDEIDYAELMRRTAAIMRRRGQRPTLGALGPGSSAAALRRAFAGRAVTP